MLPTEAQKATTGIPGPRVSPARLQTTATAGLRERIDAELIAFLETRGEHLVEVDPEAAALTQTLVEFLRAGGKRLRPLLCYWGLAWCGRA